MKNLFTIIFLVFIASGICSAQNYNWITPNQTYLKVYIIDDGIYRINKVDFTNAGISPDAIDPRTVKVFYGGNQIPIYFNGESDGVFNDTDYFDFYGKRNYGGLTNVYDEYNNVQYITDEYYNLYSDTNTYWIGWNGTNGLRFIDYTFISGITFSQNYFYKKLHFEKDLLYSYGEQDYATDERYFTNERFKGEGWYWMTMLFQNTIIQNFTSPLLASGAANCKLKIFAFPGFQNYSLTNEHALTIRMNNVLVDTLYTNHFTRIDTTIFFPSTMLNGTGNNVGSVKYTPNPSISSDAKMYFDMFEVYYPKSFIFDSSTISFSTESTDSSSKIFKIKGINTSNQINIYDIKNGYRIINNSVSSDTLIFTGKGDGNFEILNYYITKKPIRVKQRSVPNLVTNSTGADYLIVYNKLFESQVEQLRAYRNTHDGYRSFKTEIEDIYDIFNYGIENPIAVKNFIRNTYNIWTTPKLKFVCLFGRASLDPKKSLSTTIYSQNLVPNYGNPPSDGYFGNLNTGTFIYYQQIPVGRLPALTTQEAQDMVNKIIAFESQPIDKWVKQTMFIAGGYDAYYQQLFRAQSDNLLNNYLAPKPLSLFPTKVYLIDSSASVKYNYSDSIKNTFNRGISFVNFLGHAGNEYWDFCFSDPATVLSNGAKLPLIISLTCFTGKNAEGYSRGYGEKFITAPNKGAIGFISTTGWAFSSTGVDYNGFILSAMKQDTTRKIGQILSNASISMTNLDSTSFFIVNTVNSFNLLGDPATKLLLPNNPEYDIQLTDYNISNPYPSQKEMVNLAIYPKNFGTFADSCKIRLQLLKNNLNYKIKDTIVRNFNYIDTLNFAFSLDSIGLYYMKVILDVDNWVPQEIKTNNIITIPISIKNVAFVPLKPIDNSVVKSDTVEFVGLNPNIDPLRNNVKLILQLDTSNTFTSPLSSTYFNNNMTGVATKFKIRIPLLDSNIVYFWRLNLVRNLRDTAGWSKINRFNYNTNVSSDRFRFITNETKSIHTENKINLPVTDSIITIYKKKTGQYNRFDLNGCNLDTDGIRLGRFNGVLLASSFGGNAWDPTYFTVNNKMYEFVSESSWGGFNVAKIRKSNGAVAELKHFVFTSASSSDSLLNYLNTFDTTQILMIVKCIPVSVTSDLNTATRNKLRAFGSIYGDTVKVLNWSCWSFISYIGNPNIVAEAYYYNYGASTCSMQPTFQSVSGSVTHLIGPAKSWKNFSWQQILYQNSTIKFDVIGIDRNNQEVTLLSDLTNNNFVNLDSINAYQYPNLKLITKINLDSISGTQSSLFKSLKLNYIPPGEIALNNNTFLKSDSIVNGNDTIGLSLNYYNVGYSDFNGVIRNFFVYNNNGQKVIIKSDTLMNVLNIDSMNFIKTKFPVSGIPIYRRYNNSIDFNVEVQPLGQQNDFYDFNNSAVSNFVIKNLPQSLTLEVFSDGLKLMNGDYVRPKPDFLVKLNNSNEISSNIKLNAFDTLSCKFFINDTYIPYNLLNPDKSILKIEGKESGKNILVLKCNPTLPNGQNNLKLFLKNYATESYDTITYDLIVSNSLLIKDLFNYPNPMKNQTEFMFSLGGADVSNQCKIKIYTVAGRLIKEINTPANIGYNQIFWDGRDSDGDYMANGVYLYKLIVEGDSQKESAIQKLVILK
jgi:hypothetical protein